MVKRLALIGNQAFGMLNFRATLIRDLVAIGIDVHAFAPDFDETSRTTILGLGATPHDYVLDRTGMNPVRDAYSLLGLARSLGALKPDISLNYAIKPAIYGTLAGSLAGVPRIFTLIEGLGHIFMQPRSVKARLLQRAVFTLYRTALDRSEKTFFLNPDDCADFASFGLVRSERAEILGGIGVELADWPFTPVTTEPLNFVFVGRLLREKGIAELIEAYRSVKAKAPQSQLILLGDIDSNPSSFQRKEIQAWVDEGLITWPGQVQVLPWLKASTVFVLPSWREGVPRSTQEAMAVGRAIITTDVPGCRETVVDGDNGFLVPVRDPLALAEAMMQFVNQPTLSVPMGNRSRALAELKFDSRVANMRLIKAMGIDPI